MSGSVTLLLFYSRSSLGGLGEGGGLVVQWGGGGGS